MAKPTKTALLRQVEGWNSRLPIRGVARLFEEKNLLSLSFLNLEKGAKGKYYLFFGENVFEIENFLGQDFYLANIPTLESQIAIIYYDSADISPVLLGEFSSQATNLNGAIENAKKHFKMQGTTEEKGVVFQEEIYNDEAIATANYFEFEREEKGERLNSCERAIDDATANCSQNTTRKEEKEEFFNSEEPIFASDSQIEQEDGLSFYSKIKGEIESLFKDYPKEERLCQMVEQSNWVKIGDGEKHYAVGIIYCGNQPEYICYGLPGCFSQEKKVKGFSSFIPTSPFDLRGEGYWVSFQYAKNGKCVN